MYCAAVGGNDVSVPFRLLFDDFESSSTADNGATVGWLDSFSPSVLFCWRNGRRRLLDRLLLDEWWLACLSLAPLELLFLEGRRPLGAFSRTMVW